ncbi:hypothetical protein GCM10010365_11670 [Streptomyces poonensis]|uniref:Uncharacterized protein n=1 Tax=Streptomyces poonensis TaxID=68255 RepID=A0A918UDX3_9ACTN|nr:hypothetical protein GCM10010365_11670 [Streptomyces poonensis]GLJ93893.1 hypothetical protein GCM10017589_65100 [Streptomyces poonensis]
MIPILSSMVDVESPQQALRAYSSAKEYACGILCDARGGESNRREHVLAHLGERRPSPGSGIASRATPGRFGLGTTRISPKVPEQTSDSGL